MVMDSCVLMAHVWGLFGTVININILISNSSSGYENRNIRSWEWI